MKVEFVDFSNMRKDLLQLSNHLASIENGLKLLIEKDIDYSISVNIPEYNELQNMIHKIYGKSIVIQNYIEKFVDENTTPVAKELKEIVTQLTPQSPLIIMKLTQLINDLERGKRRK